MLICSPTWPGGHWVEQADLELSVALLPPLPGPVITGVCRLLAKVNFATVAALQFQMHSAN